MTSEAPISSVDAFPGVPAPLAEALSHRGFSDLTVVQRAAIDPTLEGRDLRIASQTGSGKTVAIGLVLGRALGSAADTGPRARGVAKPLALLVAPTRELAAQIGKELTWLFAGLKLRVSVVTGGTSITGDFRVLHGNPHVLVGTPGRLVDHLERGALALDETHTVVLDEADEMLDMGFKDDLDAILARMPETRTSHLVSATFANEVLALANRMQKNPARVEGADVGRPNQDIEHVAFVVHPDDRPAAMINLLLAHPNERTLVFVRTRADTSEVADGLASRGFAARALSGEMSQRERTATLEAFRDGTVQVLVATDVAARGLDVQDVARVVHYDIPQSSEVLTHRSGRTGRAGNTGQSVLFVPPAARSKTERLLRFANIRAEIRPVPTQKEVQALADARVRAELSSAAVPERNDARLRALATELLAERDPVELVAILLARGSIDAPCAPCEVTQVAPPRTVRKERPEARDARPSQRPTGDWVPFQVSWGARDGADPRRLLALVCRRGEITSSAIGAIRIGDRSSLVEVSSEAAETFSEAAMRPDPRDPRIKIRRFEATPPPPRASRPMARPRPAGHESRRAAHG